VVSAHRNANSNVEERPFRAALQNEKKKPTPLCRRPLPQSEEQRAKLADTWNHPAPEPFRAPLVIPTREPSETGGIRFTPHPDPPAPHHNREGHDFQSCQLRPP
jgi:hypothetical protein